MNEDELKPPDFWEIYHQYYQPVRSFIAAMIRDDWAADDLAQETFLSAKQNLASLREPGKLKSWLYRIARNKCLDHFRRATASREQSDERAGEGPDLKQNLVQLQLERSEMSSCVQEKIGKLPEAYRTVLILFDLAGMSHQEIAEVLEEKEGTVKVRLHRARKALKELLARECTFEKDERNVLVCLPVEDGS
ncbi:MAG: RNA polymerase sigma factor [Desulfarculaceae bacterium]|nr:RNA polymerase sigma factor [Desulfarculaceae bacterium]MCF8049559.1 RNA polymerase sigma factor [Desulfarculaceae bacterium]MCF8066844.1 RNA polymerase sigma factor [Desulfarculaceae bacterium]MCF8099941.1 RNA polymerase sigma factor [Desulfarculaceae bacterium]